MKREAYRHDSSELSWLISTFPKRKWEATDENYDGWYPVEEVSFDPDCIYREREKEEEIKPFNSERDVEINIKTFKVLVLLIVTFIYILIMAHVFLN